MASGAHGAKRRYTKESGEASPAESCQLKRRLTDRLYRVESWVATDDDDDDDCVLSIWDSKHEREGGSFSARAGGCQQAVRPLTATSLCPSRDFRGLGPLTSEV